MAAILIGTTLTGVRTNRGNPAGPMVASDVAAIASDHGLIMEVLTNKKGDNSGSAPTTSGHGHGISDGEGNIIFATMASQSFGPTNPDGYRGTTSFQNTPRIAEDSTTTAQALIVFFQPFFVPRGMEGRALLVIIQSYGNGGPQMMATLSTWGTASPPTSTVYSTETPVTGSERIVFENMNINDSAAGIAGTQIGSPSADLWVAVVTPASAGLHTLKCEVDVVPVDDSRSWTFTELAIIAALPANRLPALTGRPLPTKRLAHNASGADFMIVGDPDSTLTYDYEPVYDGIVASNDALGPAVEMHNRNSAVIEEWARGLPCAGDENMTVPSGHQHTVEAANPYGRRVEFCLGSWALGSSDTSNPALSAATRVAAPVNLTTTYKIVASVDLYIPKITEASTRVYGAVVVRSDSGKSLPTVKLTTDPNNDGMTPTTVTYTSTGGSSGYQLITSATQFTVKSGGITGLFAESKLQSVVSGKGGLMGFCFFIDE